jgi:hypothetical protein
MVNISRDKSVVTIFIETGLSCGKGPLFTYQCSNEMQAELLEIHISRRLDDTVEAIRKMDYDAGWEDAKKKKPKRTWFSVLLNKKRYF